MARRDDVTVDEVQEAIDSIVFATRYKTEDSPNPSDNSHLFLDSFLSLDVLANPIAYKVLQYLSNFLKDGLLETDGTLVFDTVEQMFSLSSSPNASPQHKTSIQELATALFSHACNALQGNTSLTVSFLEYLLKSMLREGASRWNGYSCCGPLLMTRLDSFQPHAALLLQVMLNFPETLSVIHDLYQIAPTAFVENMPLLVRLYESNFNGQLSILDIVKDLARLHPKVVAPHLANLLRIANGAKNDDVITVQEIASTCSVVVKEEPPPVEEEEHKDRKGEGSDGFDDRAEFLNDLSAKCHDVPALREFLKNNDDAVRYLRHVGQVMPLPIGVDYGVPANSSSSGRNSPQVDKKEHRASLNAKRESLIDKEAPRKSCGLACFRGDSDFIPDYIVLKFTCGGGSAKCLTRTSPLAVRSTCPPPWLKLLAVLYARSDNPLQVQIRKTQSGKGVDPLDQLLEIAQSIEFAAAAKRSAGGNGGGGRSVDGFEVLLNPFLGTDDLGDLVVDLRTEGLFSKFSLDVNTHIWTCTECSPSTAQRANMSGFLAKKGRRLGREVKRYYMLDESHLYYATNDRKPKPKRRISVSDVLSIRELPENILEIQVKKQKRAMLLKAPNKDSCQRWITSLDSLIKSSSA